ncbi:MAG: pyruvate:ferredoxin (flavodoxin) oxidoreductase, partial [Acidobacteriota bacterium]|nr:pyruvate:ferredoxin (flavodoxin) oxidoreductase [Acidobacteriota bacterium]
MKPVAVMMDGNEAAAHVAFRTNEIAAIYPITPSSPMGELADAWSARGETNLWGTVPRIIEMQSEGGAAGAVHGALQTGALTTTFTASQGLLLMLPNMYKIAGELTSTVFHVAARSVAAQALSIFGDHSDVMAARMTGWGMLFAGSVQEVMDFASIAQSATLASRVPMLHVFDGFRTSHEIAKVHRLTDAQLREMIDDELVRAHRDRGLSPDRPFIRGTAQNPDVFFQARESVNPYYLAAPEIVQQTMDRFAKVTGRKYRLFDYVGAPDAKRVLVLMGSGAETVDETVAHMRSRGEKVGVVKVRLYRPFAVQAFLKALPTTVESIAVLDRTKEPGSVGEPLYQDVVTALHEGPWKGKLPHVVGGRYGLSSKEFTPAMVKGVFCLLRKKAPRNHFTVGIHDDVTHTSIEYDPSYTTETAQVMRAVFWGLGSDGTVGANQNTIKIIGERTPNHAQGYFVYDSKKAGARTVSHLRFGPQPIKSAYLIGRANFIGVHQFGFLTRYDVLGCAEDGATVLLNAPYPPDEVWQNLPQTVQQQIVDKCLSVYAIDAYRVANELGLGARINTIMQTCFFAISGVLPRDEAIDMIKQAIRDSYGKRGEIVVRRNFAAVDASLGQLHEIAVRSSADSGIKMPLPVAEHAPTFVREVTGAMIAGSGDGLPVSALPVDGTYPSGTAQWEKRNIAREVPVWDPDTCIQCGKCVLVCPHAVIRGKLLDPRELKTAPDGFLAAKARWRERSDQQYTLQVAVEDCTGCRLCVEICPAKNKQAVGLKAINMEAVEPLREQARQHWQFFSDLPANRPESDLPLAQVKNVQLLDPLFEFSGACAGCGETPYLKLVSQLFGDRSMIANATGCSSIYGGNLPTTPWSVNKEGRGPAWSNSLFEDNAEFGLGMRVTLDKQIEYARELLVRMKSTIGQERVDALLDGMDDIDAQRERVKDLKTRLATDHSPEARDLLGL